MLTVETKRTTQEEEQRKDRGFENLSTGLASQVFKEATFGHGPLSVKILFQRNPFVFKGTNVADGTNMPNLKNVYVAELLKEIGQQLRAGLLLAMPG